MWLLGVAAQCKYLPFFSLFTPSNRAYRLHRCPVSVRYVFSSFNKVLTFAIQRSPSSNLKSFLGVHSASSCYTVAQCALQGTLGRVLWTNEIVC